MFGICGGGDLLSEPGANPARCIADETSEEGENNRGEFCGETAEDGVYIEFIQERYDFIRYNKSILHQEEKFDQERL